MILVRVSDSNVYNSSSLYFLNIVLYHLTFLLFSISSFFYLLLLTYSISLSLPFLCLFINLS